MSSIALLSTQRGAPDPADVCRRVAAQMRASVTGWQRVMQRVRTADGAVFEVTVELLTDGGWAVSVVGGLADAAARFLVLTVWEFPGQAPEVMVDDPVALPALLRELEALA